MTGAALPGASSRRVRIAALLLLAACSRSGPPAELVEPATGMRFVLIPSGQFEMGSPPSRLGHRPDEVLHRVVLRRAFYLSSTEVTQGQWIAIMGNNPSRFREAGLRVPVEQVSWFEVQEFLRRLNLAGHWHYRLPTEAEWEYACRAGTATNFNYGDQGSTAKANFDGRYPLAGQPKGLFRASTTPAGSFEPNAWGLHDMHGNVWEWCADEYCPYPATEVVDPRQQCGSRFKVIRGGSWYFGADSARSALRYTHEPQMRGFSIGFRVVCEVAPS